eukprot:Partr_v1_DN28598_c1_g1_i2_m73861 putative synthase
MQRLSWPRCLELAERGISTAPRPNKSGIGTRLQKIMPRVPSLELRADRLFYTPSVTINNDCTDDVEQRPNYDRILATENLHFITKNIKKLLDTRHPLLSTVSHYYFDAEGKKLRPLLVLLTAKMDASKSQISNKQQSLAFITEIIHTASLLHDDVIDESHTRRNQPSANARFGNKMSILAGDYLLSRASVALASMGCLPVVRLLAEVIGDLVEGEVRQVNGMSADRSAPPFGMDKSMLEDDPDMGLLFQLSPGGGVGEFSDWQRRRFHAYLQKTFMKTASLMAKSCEAAVLLRDERATERANWAFEYGRNAGMAFQV